MSKLLRNMDNEEEITVTRDDEALTILWRMVKEEVNQNPLKTVDNYSVKCMLKSHDSFCSILDFGDAPAASIDKWTKISTR